MKTIDVKVIPDITPYKYYLSADIAILMALYLQDVEDDMFPYDEQLIDVTERLGVFWDTIGGKDYVGRIFKFVDQVSHTKAAVKMSEQDKKDLVACCEDYMQLMQALKISRCQLTVKYPKRAEWALTSYISWYEEVLDQARQNEKNWRH